MKTSKKARSQSKPAQEARHNSSNAMLSGVFDSAGYGVVPLTQPFELAANNQYNPLTLNRILLNYAYMTHGPIQTFIDQPVEDAFRGGIKISCDELDADDLAEFERQLEEQQVLRAIKDTMKWAKLFGGAGLIINTDQDPATQLDPKRIGPGRPLGFIAADRWEILLNYMVEDDVECPYNYYGQVIHKSRVVKVMGKEAPSFVRQRLQGWGMSEVERCIRNLNSYVKNEDVIYQLLDEAKIDVWKIQGFNSNILSTLAKGQVNQRLQIANMTKNYHSAIVMDMEDEYEQKQITFSGLGDILEQNRIGMAASVRMPMAKLFGLSAAGFNSGEDDIENYNALVESEVRSKASEILHVILPLFCRKLFGFSPETLRHKFKPLRVLGAVEEENIKTNKFNRFDRLYVEGMLTGKEYANILEAEDMVPIKTAVGKGEVEPEPPISPTAAFEKVGTDAVRKIPGDGGPGK